MRYFIFGDVHGCLNQLKQALENAGFDRENENHTLISLGDNFDRGGLNRGVFNFLVNMPRIICIKGNVAVRYSFYERFRCAASVDE